MGSCSGIIFNTHVDIKDHINIIKFVIKNNVVDFNFYMRLACMNNIPELAKLMIHHGANDWEGGLQFIFFKLPAEQINQTCIELINLMVQNGANCWDRCFINACRYGNINFVKLAIKYGTVEFIGEFNRFYSGFTEACRLGHHIVAKFIVELYDISLENGLIVCKIYNNLGLMCWFITKGATNLEILSDIEDFKIRCLCSKYTTNLNPSPSPSPIEDEKCNKLLKLYPVYVLLLISCSRTLYRNPIERFPKELFRLLHQYI